MAQKKTVLGPATQLAEEMRRNQIARRKAFNAHMGLPHAVVLSVDDIQYGYWRVVGGVIRAPLMCRTDTYDPDRSMFFLEDDINACANVMKRYPSPT